MDFIMGGKQKNLKSDFWPEKLANIGPDYTERCRIGAFGGMFPKKSRFCQYFHEIIMISYF